MLRCVIADMQATGHHPRYVRWIAESKFLQNNELIIVGAKELLNHPEIKQAKGSFEQIEMSIDRATSIILEGNSFVGLIKRQLAYRALYAKAFHKVQSEFGNVNLIILPYIDHALDAWSALGMKTSEAPWMGVSMHSVFHLRCIPGMSSPPRRDDAVRRLFFRKLLRQRNLRKLLTIDPTMLAYAESAFSTSEYRRLAYLPDPSALYELSDRRTSRHHLSVPSEVYLVVLYGALSLRKGVRELLQAVESSRCPKQVHVLLAGKQDKDVELLLSSDLADRLRSEQRIHILNQYLDEALEKQILSSADSVWVGYIGFYRMSGVLVLAARHRIPCIFTGQGIVGHLGRTLGLGAEINPNDIQTAIDALRSLAEDPHLYDDRIRAAQFSLGAHSIESFQSTISALACEAASIDSGPMPL